MKRILVFFVALLLVFGAFQIMSFAGSAEDAAMSEIHWFRDFMLTILHIGGIIAVGFGVYQLGLAFQSHDTMQRVEGIFFIVGGVALVFSDTILNILGVAMS